MVEVPMCGQIKAVNTVSSLFAWDQFISINEQLAVCFKVNNIKGVLLMSS